MLAAYLTAIHQPTSRPHSAVGPTRSIDPARCQASAQRGREKRSRVFGAKRFRNGYMIYIIYI